MNRLPTFIENLFEGPSRRQVRPEDRPNVVVDSRTNALIVAASQKTLAIVMSLITRLDQKPENWEITVFIKGSHLEELKREMFMLLV